MKLLALLVSLALARASVLRATRAAAGGPVKASFTLATDGRPQFLVVSNPKDQKVSYVQVDSDFQPLHNEMEPLITDGLVLPQGIAFNQVTGRLYVCDTNAKKIISYELFVQRCLSAAEKATAFGLGQPAMSDTSMPGARTKCVMPYELIAKNAVDIVVNTVTTWVSVDKRGDLFYSDSAAQAIKRIGASLLADLEDGDVLPKTLKTLSRKTLEAALASNDKATSDKVFTQVLQLFDKDSDPRMGMPGGVVSDTMNVYWANELDGTKQGSILAGTDMPIADGVKSTAENLTNVVESAFGVATTDSLVVFNDGHSALYGVPKYGGASQMLTSSLIRSRGMVWAGGNTLLLADEGNDMVYSMPCGRLKEDLPIFPLISTQSPFGVAFIKSTDALIMDVFRSEAASVGSCALLILALVWL